MGSLDGYQPQEAGQLTSLPYTPPRLVINEIDYDQEGADSAEFIELYNPGPGVTPLTGVQLLLINGANNEVYQTISLSAVAPHLDSGAYLVIGAAFVIDALREHLTLPLSGSIQNGVEGVLLLDAEGNTYDSVSYEGVLTGERAEITEGGVSAPEDDTSAFPDGSIGRCPNGEDSDQNGADFRVFEHATPGEPNLCP